MTWQTTHAPTFLVSATQRCHHSVCITRSSSRKATANFLEIEMSYIFALLHKLIPTFHEPNLPLDSDYSYEARKREDRRLRKFEANIAWFRV
ncbi:hypothetical protein ACFQVB_45175 [Paraburkholderia humisilvae]